MERLPSHLILSGLIRQCDALGVSAFYRHKGDADRGGILLIFECPAEGYQLLERSSDFDGAPFWRQRPGQFSDGLSILQELEKLRRMDEDLNVLEIDCSPNQLALDAPIQWV